MNDIQHGFSALLDSSASRETVIDYLTRWPALLPMWFPRDNQIIRNLTLFDDEIADFAYHRDDTPGELWRFFFIGDPSATLLDGDRASSEVVGLFDRLGKYRDWFRKRLETYSHQFPFDGERFVSYEPEFYFVTGRRSEIGVLKDHPQFEDWSFIGEIDRDCIRPFTFDSLLLNVTDQHWYKDHPLTMGHFNQETFTVDGVTKVVP